MSVCTAILYFWQPGIDHRALMQWIIDHGFFGSIAFCSVFGTFFFHKIVEWVGLMWYSTLYTLEAKNINLPFLSVNTLKKAKLDTQEPWAWDDEDKKVGESYVDLQSRSLWYTLKYHFWVSVVQFLIFTTLITWSWNPAKGAANAEAASSNSTDSSSSPSLAAAVGLEWSWIPDHPDLTRADPALLPSKAEVAYQCLMATFWAETGFYFFHRLMHETRLYYWHKRHHEFKDATVWATFYVGFLDSVITDFIPAGLGIMYFNMHQWTIWLFTIPLIVNALRVHCGYNNARLLPLLGFNPIITLPMCTDTERTHDMHHRSNNCNYGGAYFLWDRICGTWHDPDQEVKDRKRKNKTSNGSNSPPAQLVQPVSQDEFQTATTKNKKSIKSGKSE